MKSHIDYFVKTCVEDDYGGVKQDHSAQVLRRDSIAPLNRIRKLLAKKSKQTSDFTRTKAIQHLLSYTKDPVCLRPCFFSGNSQDWITSALEVFGL
jgi:hypothetical protein